MLSSDTSGKLKGGLVASRAYAFTSMSVEAGGIAKVLRGRSGVHLSVGSVQFGAWVRLRPTVAKVGFGIIGIVRDPLMIGPGGGTMLSL